ncbi:twin-arginine translocase subunit TatC [Reinekea marinisedimentorum]|uniref:Sec-independent protein translocase protein TatC n=1 Tax=Reinekea marinisedimentorum TaxID=230495 RepID=A0A4R3IC77_9GAMM|nr:twin-arginine translocase subunit TatC [Reinekea marinisedimentorum]TCS43755.1 sec-independent protein translocase protein TatC [Reinekea marinisedimentorum]
MSAINPNDNSMPLVDHLRELRDRLIRSILVILVIFIGLYFFSGEMYLILVEPLNALLPEDGNGALIATGVASPFLVPLKLAFVMSVLVAMPYLLHQLWGFIAPALYKHERLLAIPLFISSVILFYAGVAFVYFVVLPLVFGFFTNVAPDGIQIMPDISNVLDFCLKMFFSFGIAFEIPIATFLLIRTGLVSAKTLGSVRPYIFLSCFVFGMLLTPPDVLSQSILAVPMYALFELGLLMSRFLPVAAKEKEKEEALD